MTPPISNLSSVPVHSQTACRGHGAPILFEAKANARWLLDFVDDQFACGKRFSVLNVVDETTRECLAAVPHTSISGRRVVRELTIVSDHGTEFTSNAILAWSKEQKVEWHYIAPKRRNHTFAKVPATDSGLKSVTPEHPLESS